MNKLIASLRRIISQISEHISGNKKLAATRCQFCGETGHDESECPKSAKFKLFDVDRE